MSPEQESIVVEYMPLAERLSRSLIRRCPSHIERDQLFSAACETLVRVALGFDPARTADAASYFGVRIWQGMIDELRRLDPNPRTVRYGDRRRIVQVPLEGHDDVVSDIADGVCQRLDLVDALVTLPERWRVVAVGAATGMPNAEVGVMLGIGESRVSQIRRSIVKKVSS